MTSAFDPPAAAVDEELSALPLVLLSWAVAGCVFGAALGLTAQLVGSGAALALPGLVVVVALLAGAASWVVERSFAQGRPAVPDTRGRLRRPPHAAITAGPLLLAVPGAMALVVVGSIAMQSLVPAVIFGLGGFALGWTSRRLISAHRLTEALQALEVGDEVEARRVLEGLETGWLSTRTGRVTARLNLGMLALGRGDLGAAGRWYEQVDASAGRAFARAGLAMVRVLEGRLDEAERHVLEALASPASDAVQPQLDAVRVLIVLREEGASAAVRLASSLHGEAAGDLFLGVYAAACLRADELGRARDLLDDSLRSSLEESGWASVVPEVAELLADPDL